MLTAVVQSAKLKLGKSLKYVFIILVVILTISLIRNIIKISQAGKRIDEARVKVRELKEENLKLENRLDEVQSEAYIEKELRDKLGLAKEGETILVLPDEQTLRALAPRSQEEQEVLPDASWKKWMKLFF
ncbi:hypothetical protein A2V56_02235 [Candidatus Woesebacteria bacterium RBG_19FT_COMBO_42_9]|uniref:Cell division protein FtsL n=1 Tax=Candidatus Woesebacteria bacterium RBG_16_42_24 TaxID=1802485 RepID=A0A1F7XL65_9BACT|nr:MAG: hypothetical protein A2V97_03055 [Candidatus Woesebacteria bacterium RBG_16_42_24]OGM16946.1 MAG: hypothetical protein A2V56_02235 [Candidatus Woesebacteria bacterium RBG_19FT_COMBO_42_9]OGM66428.1 MAG: hypothetical protein A2985_03195 [Candidatus Woesebacteria bacterium RIFCSPLOWO2_01_FULL_43_11]